MYQKQINNKNININKIIIHTFPQNTLNKKNENKVTDHKSAR